MKKTVVLFFYFFSSALFANEFCEQRKAEALSPYTTNALVIFEIGTGLTLVSAVFEETLKDKLQPDISQDRPLKSSSKIGDKLGSGYPNALYIAGLGAHSYFSKSELSRNRSLLMLKATLYAGATTDILKRMIREKRPNGGNYSFPSGHATTAFAFSSVVTMEHSWPWAVLANAMAVFVSVSRMNDNAHFLQDVLFGATIGSMYGVGLSYNQRKSELENKKENSSFFIVPAPGGLSARYALFF